MSYLDPPRQFNSRFHVANESRRRSPEDEALEKHVHGSLFPFAAQPFNNCFPTQLPSRKLKTYARGTFVTGSGGAASDGWGYIAACPVASQNVPANHIIFSAGTTNIAYDGFLNPTNVTTLNSPYPTASFASTLNNCRFVACSIRVRNITPMLTRGGTLYAIRSPNDYDFPVSAGSFNPLISGLDPSGSSIRCDTSGGEWQTLSWCPRDSDQMEFIPSATAITMTNAVNMQRNMAFIAQQPGPFGVGSTTAQTYEWEYCCHFEVISQGQDQSGATPSGGAQIHGATRGISHLQVNKANNIVAELQLHPKVITNTASSKVAGFITDMIAAGNGIEQIVTSAADIVEKTAAIAPRAIASVRALGAFL